MVSVDAAISEQPEIAIGNVVGSNIGNVLPILGICALITPLAVRPLALRRDAITVAGASTVFLILAGRAALGPWDGVLLIGALVIYVTWAYRTERDNSVPSADVHRAEADAFSALPASMHAIVAAIVLGLVLLISGSSVLLSGATGIATSLGVSESAIGLTLVAVGTSFPELSVSVIAAIRRHADVAVGNILGSNIFNLLGVLGFPPFCSHCLSPRASCSSTSGSCLRQRSWCCCSCTPAGG